MSTGAWCNFAIDRPASCKAHAIKRRLLTDQTKVLKKKSTRVIWRLTCIDENNIVFRPVVKDLCGFMNSAFSEYCPRALSRADVPCHCPFKKGLVQLDNSAFPLSYYLSWIEEWQVKIIVYKNTWNIFWITQRCCFIVFVLFCKQGQYEMTVRALSPQKRQLGCIKLNFHIKKRRRPPRSRH